MGFSEEEHREIDPIEKQLQAKQLLKPKIATAVGLIVEAARQSGMLEQISKVWCWRHAHCDVAMADELGEELLAELIEIFDNNIHMPGDIVETLCGLEPYNIGTYSAEEIASFSGLRVR